MTEIVCCRCGQTSPAVSSVPHPEPLGSEIVEKTCAQCWTEWQKTEVIVINELRLDFMDPRSQDILAQHMREFLCLDGQPPVAQ